MSERYVVEFHFGDHLVVEVFPAELLVGRDEFLGETLAVVELVGEEDEDDEGDHLADAEVDPEGVIVAVQVLCEVVVD